MLSRGQRRRQLAWARPCEPAVCRVDRARECEQLEAVDCDRVLVPRARVQDVRWVRAQMRPHRG